MAAAPEFSRLNDSFRFDYRLLPFDIEGSIAYAKALLRARILTTPEAQHIESGLRGLKERYEGAPAELLRAVMDYEDVHSFVESKLTERIGDAARKLHTGRSRNEQVVLDLRLYLRERNHALRQQIVGLMQALVANAGKHLRVILPGYTHLQRAQPVLLSHYWLAHFEMLARDVERLDASQRRCDVLPLGSGALAGNSIGIDRNFLAQQLFFPVVSANSLDAVSDRDFVLEFIACASILMMHLSRLAEDLILYSTSEFDFIELSDAVTSGSSLMPQKKNPDALELARGKTGRVYGNLQRLLTTMKALPLTYNKDLQEDKEALFDTVETLELTVLAMTRVVRSLKVHPEIMRRASTSGYLNATDCADYLVRKGLPFRSAHEVLGKIVLYAIQKGIPLEKLTLKEFQTFSPSFKNDVYAALDLPECIESKSVKGGTATRQVRKAIRDAKQHLKKLS